MSEWDEITSFANLCRAARRAARGKRRVAGTARFLERLEPESLALERALRAGTWRPSPPTTFVIRDPKVREITAAPFRDRVVHHALIDPLESRFDAALGPETFACRRGMGTHRALDRAQELVRTHSHFLKLDVASCFASIEHGVVRQTLESFSLDLRTLELANRLLEGPGGEEVGLPIGNLTSQWFANLVLGRLDLFVIEELQRPGYLRYMDDFVLFADRKTALREALASVEHFVGEELQLRLKERATILAPVRQGLPFLGWRIYPGLRRLRPENARRTRRRLRRRRWELRTGRRSPASYVSAVRSVLAHVGSVEAGARGCRFPAALFASEEDLHRT